MNIKYMIPFIVILLLIGGIVWWEKKHPIGQEYINKEGQLLYTQYPDGTIKSQNYYIDPNQGFKVVPLTPLNEEQMKVQKEQGCKACHKK